MSLGFRTLGMAAQRMPAVRSYDFRPYTDRNIGKDWLKPGRNNRHRPHQGKREIERRRRQLAAGQLTGEGT